jgi:hypothetical protein
MKRLFIIYEVEGSGELDFEFEKDFNERMGFYPTRYYVNSIGHVCIELPASMEQERLQQAEQIILDHC